MNEEKGTPKWLVIAKRKNSQIQLSFVFLYWLHLRRVPDCLRYHFPQLLHLWFTWVYLSQAKWNSNGLLRPLWTGLVPSQPGPLLASGQGSIFPNAEAKSVWHNLHEAIYWLNESLLKVILLADFSFQHSAQTYPSATFPRLVIGVFNPLPVYSPQADFFPFLTGNMQS